MEIDQTGEKMGISLCLSEPAFIKISLERQFKEQHKKVINTHYFKRCELLHNTLLQYELLCHKLLKYELLHKTKWGNCMTE